MRKTLSIIIPCYKQAHFLGECIESVLEQSVKPDEIIVVNDGSPDNTSEVARKYSVIVVEKENGGLSSARNAGIKRATSEYIMPLDADDMLRPDAIKELMAIAGENVIAQAGLMYFGAQVATFRPMGATLESILRSNTVYCNSVFPKALWEKVKYDESDTMRLGLEDWLYWVELMAHGAQVKTTDYIALLYRRHANTMTKNTTHPRWNEITGYMTKKLKDKYGLTANFHSIVANE